MQARDVGGEPALPAFQLVEVALGVLQFRLVGDAGGAADGEQTLSTRSLSVPRSRLATTGARMRENSMSRGGFAAHHDQPQDFLATGF